MDIPLSLSFLKMLCWRGFPSTTNGLVSHSRSSILKVIDDASCVFEDCDETLDTTNELDQPQPSFEDNENAINKLDWESSKERELIEEEEELSKEENSELSKTKESVEELPSSPLPPCWFAGILDDSDMEIVDPHRAAFLKQLQELVARKSDIVNDDSLSADEKKARISELKLKTAHGAECSVDDLGFVGIPFYCPVCEWSRTSATKTPRLEIVPVSVAWSKWKHCHPSPLDRMPVQRRVTWC